MKLQNKILYSIGICALLLNSCENPLENTQLDIIGEDKVWADEGLIDSYMANVYNIAEFQMGNSGGSVRMHSVIDAGGEALAKNWPDVSIIDGTMSNSGASGNIDYWNWEKIRTVNEVIKKLSNPESSLPSDYRNTTLGEAYFIRAWMYFSMAKRYGGLPVIKEPQDVSLSLEELQIARSTEEETYDFIAEDLDMAVSLLNGKIQDWGKATKWAALALKSRAMLYAGSIGEFGTVQADGLVGISNADKFWNLSLEASTQIIQSGEFELYDEVPNGTHAEKITSYENMTLIDDPSSNKELIFTERYNGAGGKGSNNIDLYFHPVTELDGSWGSNSQVYLEFIEKYERADGSPGTIDRSILVPGNRLTLDEVLGVKDPRYYASIAYQESDFGGVLVYVHEGTYRGGNLGTGGTSANGIPGIGYSKNYSRTGFMNIKGITRGVAAQYYEGTNDWIVFRLGEIYLNYAEAQLGLGTNLSDGLNKLNAIRERAGMPTKNTLDWPTLKHERAIELAFENHRYWDLRRWRDAVDVLTDISGGGSSTFTGLYQYYDEDADKYEILIANETDRPEPTVGFRRFEEKHYYFPISSSIIAGNPVLIQNPGY